jgi:hypothetical protein
MIMERQQDRRGDGIHLLSDDARAGTSPHIVRYVLAFSLTLAIIATSIIWISGAVSVSQ